MSHHLPGTTPSNTLQEDHFLPCLVVYRECDDSPRAGVVPGQSGAFRSKFRLEDPQSRV